MTKIDKVGTHTVSTMGSISYMVDTFEENDQMRGNVDFRKVH